MASYWPPWYLKPPRSPAWRWLCILRLLLWPKLSWDMPNRISTARSVSGHRYADYFCVYVSLGHLCFHMTWRSIGPRRSFWPVSIGARASIFLRIAWWWPLYPPNMPQINALGVA